MRTRAMFLTTHTQFISLFFDVKLLVIEVMYKSVLNDAFVLL